MRIYDRGELDILTHWESRDYAKADDLDDFRRIDLDFRHRHSLNSRYFIREEGELEVISFDSTDYLTSGYGRYEFAAMVGVTGLRGSLAVGPRLEILSENQADPQMIGEDYVEFGVQGQFDLISAGWPFVSLETITGRRNLKDNDPSRGFTLTSRSSGSACYSTGWWPVT